MTQPPTLLFLGGNGHDPVRLEAARAALAERGDPFVLHELRYGLGGDFDDLLSDLTGQIASAGGGTIYATGIGALVALALRARGEVLDQRLILQGGVLWGLERRWFPRLMRLGPMPELLAAAFRVGALRRHFAAKHFRSEPSPDFLGRFFDGYDDAGAFATWFRWLTPGLLRQLERELPRSPGALGNLEAWWGERETVVAVEELRVTEAALGVTVPLRTFPDWGHYPMIDDPGAWIEEVSHVVAAPAAV